MLEAVSFPVLLVYTDSPKPNLKSGGYWKKNVHNMLKNQPEIFYSSKLIILFVFRTCDLP